MDALYHATMGRSSAAERGGMYSGEDQGAQTERLHGGEICTAQKKGKIIVKSADLGSSANALFQDKQTNKICPQQVLGLLAKNKGTRKK